MGLLDHGDIVAGQPDAGGAQLPALVAQHLVQWAVGGDGAVEDHDAAVHQVCPHVHTVLDDDQGGSGALQHTLGGCTHFVDSVRVEIGGRFVEQQQTRTHGQDAGQRQALLLPAGELGGGMVQWQVQAHGIQRVSHPDPDLLAGDAEVLAAESDIVPQASQHHLGLRVLHDQSDTLACGVREAAVECEFAQGLALVLAAQQAGEPAHQRGLARTRGAEHQYPLARRDVEVHVAQSPRPASGMPPSPPTRAHPYAGNGADLGQTRRVEGHGWNPVGIVVGNGRRGGRDGDLCAGSVQTRPRISRPAANRSRAPVWASPRTSSQPTRPARTRPVTIIVDK